MKGLSILLVLMISTATCVFAYGFPMTNPTTFQGAHFVVSQSGKWALIGVESQPAYIVLLDIQSSDTSIINARFNLGVQGWSFGFAKNDSIVWYTGDDRRLYFVDISSKTVPTSTSQHLQKTTSNPIYSSVKSLTLPTTLHYLVLNNSFVEIILYNSQGRRVSNIVPKRYHEKGEYSVIFNGTDDHGNILSSGSYVYVIRGAFLLTQEHMTIIK